MQKNYSLKNLLVIYMILAVDVQHVKGRSFTVTNNCPFTIWPAVFTDLNVGTAVPNVSTGWEAPAFSSVTFDVPNNWRAGRIWARRNCNFSITPVINACLDGGCNGGLLCDPHTGTGIPPASVAEWTLSGDGNQDFYDTSLVDGYNLPLRIENNVGCPVADCPVDLGPGCPDPLKGPFDSTGFPVGCNSACQANLDGNQNDSPNCCSGSHNTAATCPPSTVDFYSYFKGNCPNSYAYAFDESSGTALWKCDSSLNANYTLTFCPPTTTTTNPSNEAATALPDNVSVQGPSFSATSPPSGSTQSASPLSSSLTQNTSSIPVSSTNNGAKRPSGRGSFLGSLGNIFLVAIWISWGTTACCSTLVL